MNSAVGIMQNQFRELAKVDFGSLPADRQATVSQQMSKLKQQHAALEKSAQLLLQKNPEKSGAVDHAQSTLKAGAFS